MTAIHGRESVETLMGEKKRLSADLNIRPSTTPNYLMIQQQDLEANPQDLKKTNRESLADEHLPPIAKE